MFYDMNWLERLLFLKRIKGGGWISEIESVPYNYRHAPDLGHEYNSEYDEIVGASVGWNQLASLDTSLWSLMGCSLSASGQELTFTVTSSGVKRAKISAETNHVYYFKGQLKASEGASISAGFYNVSNTGLSVVDRSEASYGSFEMIYKPTTSGCYYGLAMPVSTPNGTSGYAKDVNAIDLTLFNSQIADYVYTLEQSTAGSGVAWLKTHFPKLFDNGYQPFDSGSIKSVSGLEAHEMVGVNLWGGLKMAEDIHDAVPSSTLDTTAKTIVYEASAISGKVLYDRLFPNTQYTIILHGDNSSSTKATNMLVKYTDGSYTYLPNFVNGVSVFTTDSAKSVLNIQGNWGTSQTTLYYEQCGLFEGVLTADQFEPYEKHTYPLDSSVTLRGKYVLDNGQLKAVGDVWKSVGTITRNYGVVDLGSLNWRASDGFFESRINDRSNGGAVCAKYEFYGTVQYPTIKANLQEKQFAFTSNSAYKYIEVKDSTYSSASDFKTAMSGVYLVYELATPTTETAPTYDNPQWCDANGTEEYVGSELPVGHNTRYAK